MNKKLSEQVADLENELTKRISKPSLLARQWEDAYFQLLNRYADERMALIALSNPEMYQFLNTPVDALSAPARSETPASERVQAARDGE